MFLPDDISAVNSIISGVIARYSEKATQMGRNRLSYQDSLKLSPKEFEEYYRIQLEADKKMQTYKR